MIQFDYHYEQEADRYTFYRIPKALYQEEMFRTVSDGAKVLYGMLLELMGLSRQNGWIDELGRVYIRCGISRVKEMMSCSNDKAVKMLKELDVVTGVGLIEKERRGQGKATVIYVKSFIVSETVRVGYSENQNNSVNEDVDNPTDEGEIPSDYSENQNSKIPENRIQEFRFSESNNKDKSNTEKNYTHPINLSWKTSEDKADIHEIDQIDGYRALIRENIEYDDYMVTLNEANRDLFCELYKVICDTVCIPREKIRINGTDYPYEVVKSRFLQLKGCHLAYVIESMSHVTGKISNIHSYLRTALYRSIETMEHYYKQRIQYDFYGSEGG